MSLAVITELSRKYGADPRFVLAGGGNTSYKDERILYVKPSGVRLADIRDEDFVRMERAKVREVFKVTPPDNADKREALIKHLMQGAVCPGETGRPSVEAPLHEALSSMFVVHLHPAAVNGMTCGRHGREMAAKLFPEALWVEFVDPGFMLSIAVQRAVVEYEEKHGREPSVIFLGNHGVFVAADSAGGIDREYAKIMKTLSKVYAEKDVPTDLQRAPRDAATVLALAPALRSRLGGDGGRATVVGMDAFAVAEGPLTPDHIVYAGSYALSTDVSDEAALAAYREKHGLAPRVIAVPGKAVFCAGPTLRDARTVGMLAWDAALVQQLTAAFGGPEYLGERERRFIENWEVESYRKKVAAGGGLGRLHGRVAVVTGGAQGFGLGIAEGLAAAGATVAVADLNADGAKTAAEGLCARFGADRAFPVAVNVSDEASVQAMCEEITLKCGGMDLFIANAGVLKAGSVKEMTKQDWDLVTAVNYTGFFLCVKHASRIMARQNVAGGGWTDILQINSKSGLQGSNRNAAYAGGKFGGVGQTQSFAMELVEDRIKVNCICPGNYFEGPLWSDPEKGLFVQYLNSGKVPGAKTIEDVRKAYESKVLMGRGCLPGDVVRAILYCVEQEYETGQAIPVAGGQVMLH
jgi:NAD(P)-dependent dehydrogenase (short-subunit alcohol dehydrogenase family)/rhamnose utilization protein RhaD (predicted bifunctional aldolase and dehydrogenase)